MKNFEKFRLCFFLMFIALAGCRPPVMALNQLTNSDFLANSAGWFVDNMVLQANNLTSHAWTAADGNPIGSFYGAYNRGGGGPNNLWADGILQQSFVTPNAPGKVSIRFSHKENWTVGGIAYDRFNLGGTLRSGGVYPNEIIISTFFTENTINGAARHAVWTAPVWSAPVSVLANTTYIVRMWWDIRCDPNERAGAWIDNFECNLSPTGLTVANVAGNAVLNWNASVGTVALAGFNGYQVYRSAVSGGPYVWIGQSDTPTFTDSSTPTGAPQYYVVTDVDINGVESPYSFEVMCERTAYGDSVYQVITNLTNPWTPILNNQTYFPTFYILATDSTRVNSAITFQVREWSKTDRVTPLAVHSWSVSASFLKQRIGEWTRIGTGKYNDMFSFTSVADPNLGSFSIELGFGAGALPGDAYMVDGVQLEKAQTLPSSNKTIWPTAWGSEKGIITPSESEDIQGAKQYYAW